MFTLAMLAVLFGCGPSARESGTSVGLLAPLVFLIEDGLFRLLLRGWRAVSDQPIDAPRQPWLAGHAAHVTLAILVAIVGVPVDAGEWIIIALWAFGTSHLAVALVIWRVWLFWDRTTAFPYGPLVASMILLPLALPYAAGLFEGQGAIDLAFALWLWPGLAGWIPGGLIVVFGLEILIRWWIRRRRHELVPAPPESP